MGIAIERSIKNLKKSGACEQKENERAIERRFRNKSEPLYCDAVGRIIHDRRKLETPLVIGTQFASQTYVRFHSDREISILPGQQDMKNKWCVILTTNLLLVVALHFFRFDCILHNILLSEFTPIAITCHPEIKYLFFFFYEHEKMLGRCIKDIAMRSSPLGQTHERIHPLEYPDLTVPGVKIAAGVNAGSTARGERYADEEARSACGEHGWHGK